MIKHEVDLTVLVLVDAIYELVNVKLSHDRVVDTIYAKLLGRDENFKETRTILMNGTATIRLSKKQAVVIVKYMLYHVCDAVCAWIKTLTPHVYVYDGYEELQAIVDDQAAVITRLSLTSSVAKSRSMKAALAAADAKAALEALQSKLDGLAEGNKYLLAKSAEYGKESLRITGIMDADQLLLQHTQDKYNKLVSEHAAAAKYHKDQRAMYMVDIAKLEFELTTANRSLWDKLVN